MQGHRLAWALHSCKISPWDRAYFLQAREPQNNGCFKLGPTSIFWKLLYQRGKIAKCIPNQIHKTSMLPQLSTRNRSLSSGKSRPAPTSPTSKHCLRLLPPSVGGLRSVARSKLLRLLAVSRSKRALLCSQPGQTRPPDRPEPRLRVRPPLSPAQGAPGHDRASQPQPSPASRRSGP